MTSGPSAQAQPDGRNKWHACSGSDHEGEGRGPRGRHGVTSGRQSGLSLPGSSLVGPRINGFRVNIRVRASSLPIKRPSTKQIVGQEPKRQINY